MSKAESNLLDLVKKLLDTLTHHGPDMGGKDRYSTSHKSQPIIRELFVIVNKEKGNFYAIFVFTWVIAGILLFLTFWFPIIPQVISNIFGGGL